MSRVGDSRGSSPSIGIVSDAVPLASRIEAALKESGCKVAFVRGLHESANDAPEARCELLVVYHEPHSRSAIELVRIRKDLPGVPIVACMEHVNRRGLRMAIDHGAAGIVWDSELERTLGPTVRAVLTGQLVVPRDSYRPVDPAKLTNREKQCLSLMIMGLTNQEIAQKLFLAEATVKSHLNAAYRKLGVHSRTEAAKLITDPDEGLGAGILAITAPGLARGLKRK